MIAIVSYDAGNIGSVFNACERIGAEAFLCENPKDLNNATGIILPGVGAFPDAMKALSDTGFIPAIISAKESGTPILGICLGMQVFFEKGFEGEEAEGFGFFKGNVSKIRTTEILPHIGWNDIHFTSENNKFENKNFYFVHSYAADFGEDIKAWTEYGGTKIPAIASKENVTGFQFHPEKSGKDGEDMLKEWSKKCL
jgi:glutamine amidotransferase